MIVITPNAAVHIRRMIERRDRGEAALRLGVRAGGCSGFEYTFGWERSPRPGDAVFDAHGATVFVDAKSLRLLDGTVLDYDTSLLSRGFLLENPNVQSTCGCGTSFSVTEPARTPASGENHDHTGPHD